MSTQRSLSVNDGVFSQFNALKVRIAQSNNNRIPTSPDVIAALLVIGNRHYPELLFALGLEGEPE
jgi:hypothetical protein